MSTHRIPTPRARRGLAVAGLLLGAVLLPACGSDGSDEAATTTDAPTTTEATTTTEAATTTEATTTTTAPAGQPDTAVWPYVGDEVFDDPVAVATSFAVDNLGFVDPVVGEFQQGDSRSGEVAIQPAEQGPTTTVLVRQAGTDDAWWVIGAATANITLESPEVLTAISSPVAVSGQSTAFEANVNIEVREDGSLAPLVEDFVMGGANGEMGPFAKDISFAVPDAASGAIVLRTFSMEDGRTWEATVIRVAFATD